MALLKEHLKFYREIFEIPDFFLDPLLTIGFEEITGKNLPRDFSYPDFKVFLESRGVSDITTLDLFDNKADLQIDLNYPVSKKMYEKYNTLIDIGNLEHIFDTRQALENCLRMVKVGGTYFLHTPVNGYFKHGLHTFNPEGLIGALKLNGFKIVYEGYSTVKGTPIKDPSVGKNVILWLVAKKLKGVDKFVIPQQGFWDRYYKNPQYHIEKDGKNKKSYYDKLKEKIKLIWYAADLV